MSSVAFIDPAEDRRWDAFVESHPHGLICHLSGWKQVLELSFPHIKGYFPVIFDAVTGGIRAGLPVYLVNSRITGKRLVSIPFATLCDPLSTRKDDLEKLLGAIKSLSTRVSASNIELRTLASANLFENSGFKGEYFFKNHFLPLDEPAEHLIKRFDRKSIRPRLKRCERIGLELNIESNRKALQIFYRLYAFTRKRLGLPPPPFRYFEQLWRVFGPSGRLRILGATYHGKPLASMMLFRFKERVSWEAIGEHPEYRRLNPTHYLLWQAILLAHAEGYKVFDFGRTSPNNIGLMEFKKRWGTTVNDLPQFWYPSTSVTVQQKTENSLIYRAARDLVRKFPGSLLRLLGELCYRHMG